MGKHAKVTGTRINIRDKFPKSTELEVIEAGFDIDGEAFCLHCNEEILVSEVLEDETGDWCPMAECDGGGWGIDLYPEPWWRG